VLTNARLNKAIQQILKPKLHELRKGVWKDCDHKSETEFCKDEVKEIVGN